MRVQILSRTGRVRLALLAFACILLLGGSSAFGALPGKQVAKRTATDAAYLADATIWSTTPGGCFYTFRSGYPCLRLKNPNRIWIVASYPNPIGWEFGDSSSGFPQGWKILCGKGTRVAERRQSGRDGLKPGFFWVGQKVIRLPIPMKNPAWCEVYVETSSPTYSDNWNTEQIVTSQVQIRASFRRR